MNGELPCPNCGGPVGCGVICGESHCWCFDLPHGLPVSEGTDCLCRKCLEQALQQRQSELTKEAADVPKESATPQHP